MEEVAQRIYKEWFVNLHIPGYKNVKIVNGVPEGWRKVGLSNIAPIITGKKDANFGTQDGNYLFFTCSQEPIRSSAYSFDCDAVILAGNGDFSVNFIEESLKHTSVPMYFLLLRQIICICCILQL